MRPPKPLQDRETRWDKNSSQADSAGSIPVTRSTREKRCNTSEFGRVSQAGRRSFTSETAPVPPRVPLAILASAPWRLSVPKLTVRLQFPGTPLLRLAGRDDRHSERVGRRAPCCWRRDDPFTAGRCPGPSAQRTVAVTRSATGRRRHHLRAVRAPRIAGRPPFASDLDGEGRSWDHVVATTADEHLLSFAGAARRAPL